jgi:hypothetical protein
MFRSDQAMLVRALALVCDFLSCESVVARTVDTSADNPLLAVHELLIAEFAGGLAWRDSIGKLCHN